MPEADRDRPGEHGDDLPGSRTDDDGACSSGESEEGSYRFDRNRRQPRSCDRPGLLSSAEKHPDHHDRACPNATKLRSSKIIS